MQHPLCLIRSVETEWRVPCSGIITFVLFKEMLMYCGLPALDSGFCLRLPQVGKKHRTQPHTINLQLRYGSYLRRLLLSWWPTILLTKTIDIIDAWVQQRLRSFRTDCETAAQENSARASSPSWRRFLRWNLCMGASRSYSYSVSSQLWYVL